MLKVGAVVTVSDRRIKFAFASACPAKEADTTSSRSTATRRAPCSVINPKKPGCPSHTYHSFFLSNLRLVPDVEVMAGNQHGANHAAPGLWALLTRIGRDRWPRLLRADKGFTSDALMRTCGEEGLAYLVRLRLTKNVKCAIERLAGRGGWQDAGRPRAVGELAGHRHNAQACGLGDSAPRGAGALGAPRASPRPTLPRGPPGTPDQLLLSFPRVAHRSWPP